ncbi:pimeloyl-ACP methyl ester carboxylesterase [Streptomyces sp. 3211.6]|uniref:alpha/beta hydrolase n=1 Tax=Streptomyces TaxID=1883 RepID=UPI0009A4A33A|nr:MULTISPECIES: alpha/beta hydrolase [Streptomyces]RKT02625.1 pimeloyl-ACP methyl ester carboxylesterase [Streptomyces sp. 3211.6]RPF43950.1 pimeloyl-ACP methyl ester carboxylesterase [Streptomyces sp. Ag109_G2-6]
MTTHRTKASLLALATATALTAAAVPAASAAPVAAEGPRTPAPRLDWHPCAKPGGPAAQECADLPVPLDYADPAGPRISVAVSRIRSDRPAARRGTLVVIPGGPGGSGVQRLTQKGAALQKELGGTYDLVAFDPRGVGGSTTAHCGIAPEDRYLTALRSWPGPGGDISGNVDRSRRIAEACAANGGPVLRSFTTANQVRDMDRLRTALGERKLSAWGVSYGTYVGAVYAQTYPGRTDRWVLDSSGDPDPQRVARGWLANMAKGADDRFPDFAAWAAHPDRDREGLRLAQRPEEVEPLVLSLAEALDRIPRPSATEGVPLTGNGLRQALQNALYSDSAFPAFARLLVSLRDPAATPALPPELAQPLRDQDAAQMVAVICNDVAWPLLPAAGRQRAVDEDRARHPLTAGMPVNVTPCSFWKDRPVQKPTRITDDGPSDVLMVQSRRDPATPHSESLKMRRALGGRAVMVTVEQGGHGMYLGNGNACGDRAVTRFLTTGVRPARDTDCPN